MKNLSLIVVLGMAAMVLAAPAALAMGKQPEKDTTFDAKTEMNKPTHYELTSPEDKKPEKLPQRPEDVGRQHATDDIDSSLTDAERKASNRN